MNKEITIIVNKLSSEVDNFNYAIFEDKHEQLIKEVVEVSEKFAIDFNKWIKNNFSLHQKGEKYYLRISSILWKDNTPTVLYSEKELLEIYKQRE